MPRDWRYRFIDGDEVVHIESNFGARPKQTSTETACGIHVMYGMIWDDDWRMVVTCVRCMAAR